MSRLSKFAFASIAACLSAGVQADTVCSKSMLRNIYGVSGTGAGFTTLGGGGPISCGVNGVLEFALIGGVDKVSIKRLNEVCALNSKVLTANFGDPTGTQVYTATKYDLNPATCTAKLEFSNVGTGGGAFLQVTFTDNGQSLHFAFERTDFANYGVSGSGTGSRL